MAVSKSIGMYTLGKTLGVGSFGLVMLGTHIITKQQVAVKILDKTFKDPEASMSLYREAHLMEKLDHPNIVKLLHVIDFSSHLFLVMEYVPGGDLFTHVKDHRRMTELEARAIFRQIGSAVQYCHQQGVVHRDLKMENILLDSEMNIKLADFGLSRQFTPGSLLSEYSGSPQYVAPELVLAHEHDGPAADVWALGVILYLLVTRQFPFTGATKEKLHLSVVLGLYPVPSYLSFECKALLKKILVRDASERASLVSIMQDKWTNIGYEDDQLKPGLEGPSERASLVSTMQDVSPNTACEDDKRKSCIEPLPDLEDPKPSRQPQTQTLDFVLMLAAVLVVVVGAICFYLFV